MWGMDDSDQRLPIKRVNRILLIAATAGAAAGTLWGTFIVFFVQGAGAEGLVAVVAIFPMHGAVAGLVAAYGFIKLTRRL